jgi:hypothetical protein
LLSRRLRESGYSDVLRGLKEAAAITLGLQPVQAGTLAGLQFPKILFQTDLAYRKGVSVHDMFIRVRNRVPEGIARCPG